MPDATTLIQFGGEAGSPPDGRPPAGAPGGAKTGRACKLCGQRFSAEEARFCPFDGEPLESVDWDPSGDPLLGQVIDNRYEVMAVLGEGGMGTVYRVRHKTLERPLALKALRRDLCRDADLPARFIQEAKAAAAVEHPNVVQITDFGTLKTEQPYFVMELLEGETLSNLMREHGQISPARAVGIATQVAEALAAAHTAGVIHRDLKPDNIHIRKLGNQDVVKVLDFGLAKIAGASRLTKQGMVFGTPHYMSPEQAAGEPSDHRVDIYALGVVMYEMLTGCLPFEADSFTGVLAQHMYKDPRTPSEITGSTLGPVEDVVMRCLAKKADERYATMGDLLAELDRIGVLLSAHRQTTGRRRAESKSGEVEISFEKAPRGLGQRSTLIAAAVVAVFLVFGFVLVVFRSAPAPDARATPSPAEPVAKPDPLPTAPAALRVEPAVTAPVASETTPPATGSAETAKAAGGPPKAAPEMLTKTTNKQKAVTPPASEALAPPPTKKPPSKAVSGTEIINPWQ